MQPSEISDAGLDAVSPPALLEEISDRFRRMGLLLARSVFTGLADDRSGAAAVEYALLISAIAGVIVAIVFFLGTEVVQLYGPTCQAMNNNNPC
jgi:Flp pilus assembly pilin Flp